MEKISINDIEKLFLHADEVLTQIRFSRFHYDDNGDYKNNTDGENPADEKYLDFIRRRPIPRFLEANAAALDKIKGEYLQPHLALALSLFRNGILGQPYYVDESVSDEYLITLLAIQCKDVLRIFAIQKELKSAAFYDRLSKTKKEVMENVRLLDEETGQTGEIKGHSEEEFDILIARLRKDLVDTKKGRNNKMPTYYEIIMIVSGTQEGLKEFAEKCKGYDMYVPNSSDDYSREIDAFIRKTEAAKRKEYGKNPVTGRYSQETIERSKAEAAAEAAKKFRPRTEEEIAAATTKHRQEHFSQPPYFGLSNLHPEPEGNATSENWRNWRMENWGCKYAFTTVYEECDDHIRVVLDAANGSILPWTQKVSMDFPCLAFELKWDGGPEKGRAVIKDGEVLTFHNSIPD